MKKKMTFRQFPIKPDNIDLIVYDFDGVMTDNRVLVLEDGREAVLCNRADGLAIQKIKELGIPQIILSTERNRVVELRGKKLGIGVIHGVSDKRSAIIDWCKKRHCELDRVLYIGNDINDLEAMRVVGYPIAPQDANDRVKDIAAVVLKRKGGEGVIREFYESILS